MKNKEVKKKTILHITTAHQPQDVRIFHREAKLLTNFFEKVIILAFDCKEKEVDNVEFLNLPFSRPKNRMERIKSVFKIKAILSQLESRKIDLIHFHDPELLLTLPKWGFKKRIPVVYDVHEYYEGTLFENSGKGLKGYLASKLYAMAERFSMRYISGIVTVTEQISNFYQKKYKKPIVILKNYPDVKRIIELNGDKTPKVEDAKLLYSGSLEQKSLYPLAEAIKNLSSKYPQITVTLIGDFVDQNEKERILNCWREKGVFDRLILKGRMQRDDFLKGLSNYSVGLVLFWPTKNAEVALPNKLFEYMAAGLPVIAPDLQNQRQVVMENDCGVVCNTADFQSITDAIDKILSDNQKALQMGENGRMACLVKCNCETEIEKLVRFYEEIFGE